MKNLFLSKNILEDKKRMVIVGLIFLFLIYSISFSEGSSCISNADSDDDSVVSISELLSFISGWKSGSVTISELLNGISEWKGGCHEQFSEEPIIFVLEDELYDSLNGDFDRFNDMVQDINYTFSKNTLKRYYLQEVVKYSEIDLGDIHTCPSMKDRPMVTYILYWSVSGNMGACFSKGSIVYVWDVNLKENLYFPQKNEAERTSYLSLLSTFLHEMEHISQAGVPEYYLYDWVQWHKGINDTTGVEPNLGERFVFEDDYPENINDPLTANQQTFSSINEGLETFKFGSLAVELINRDKDHLYEDPLDVEADMDKKIKVIDESTGEPISDAEVRFFPLKTVAGNGNFDSTVPDIILNTDANGLTDAFNPNRLNGATSNIPVVARAVKVFKDGYLPAGKILLRFDIQQALWVDKQNEFILEIELTPS